MADSDAEAWRVERRGDGRKRSGAAGRAARLRDWRDRRLGGGSVGPASGVRRIDPADYVPSE